MEFSPTFQHYQFWLQRLSIFLNAFHLLQVPFKNQPLCLLYKNILAHSTSPLGNYRILNTRKTKSQVDYFKAMYWLIPISI